MPLATRCWGGRLAELDATHVRQSVEQVRLELASLFRDGDL